MLKQDGLGSLQSHKAVSRKVLIHDAAPLIRQARKLTNHS